MENITKTLISKVEKMNSKERLIRLCELAVKEENGTIQLHEQLEIETIQMLRIIDGELTMDAEGNLSRTNQLQDEQH